MFVLQFIDREMASELALLLALMKRVLALIGSLNTRLEYLTRNFTSKIKE